MAAMWLPSAIVEATVKTIQALLVPSDESLAFRRRSAGLVMDVEV
jgi:hypothetical protein